MLQPIPMFPAGMVSVVEMIGLEIDILAREIHHESAGMDTVDEGEISETENLLAARYTSPNVEEDLRGHRTENLQTILPGEILDLGLHDVEVHAILSPLCQ